MIDVQEEAHGLVPLPLMTREGAPVAFGDVTELRIILRDHLTGTVLNGRNGANPMGPDVRAVGTAIVWDLQPADNVIVDATLGYELHTAEVAFVAGVVLQRFARLVRVANLGRGTLTPPPLPDPDAPAWSFDAPLVGDRPGRTFTLPSVPLGVQVFHQGAALFRTSTPGLGEFALAGAVITTGFDVQPGDALWAHVFA